MKKTLLALCAGLALCASAQTYKQGEAFAYNIDNFVWFEDMETYWDANENWPANSMLNGASLEDNYGLGMIWFAGINGGAFAANCPTLADCNAQFPVVDSPWTTDAKAIKVQVTETGWWGYGNMNFALPKMDKVSRIRLVYRVYVDEPEKDWARFEAADDKPFHVRLTDTTQDGCFTDPIYEENPSNFWDNPGFRVIDLYYQPNGQTYLALTTDTGGISVNTSRPGLYIQEISVVPVDLLEGDDHESGYTGVSIQESAPEAVVIAAATGEEEEEEEDDDNEEVDSISEINAAANGSQVIYDLQGRKVANAVKGLYIINGVKTIVK